MNLPVNIILLLILFIIALCILICFAKDIINVVKTIKENGTPYYKLNLTKYIIYLELELIFLDVITIISYFLFIGGIDMSLLTEILINIGCSLAVSTTITLIVYFKFLKHIPEETKKQIDTLLNDRLGYETTNHNAVLQKADSAQNFLSNEHSEIKQGICNIDKMLCFEIVSRKARYENLTETQKDINRYIESINGLMTELEKTNYENIKLKKENKQLTQENADLTERLSHYQATDFNNNFTQGMNFTS